MKLPLFLAVMSLAVGAPYLIASQIVASQEYEAKRLLVKAWVDDALAKDRVYFATRQWEKRP